MKIRLDSILLPVLIFPFILNFRISWLETPFWLFGCVFFLLVFNICLDVYLSRHKSYEKIKTTLFWFISSIVIISSFVSAIIVRHQTSPIYMIHDTVLQQEAAVRFLVHGVNPYSADYFQTPLAKWHYSDFDTNPALYHFVDEPFYVIFAIPFYLFAGHVFGFFDGRIPLLVLFFISGILAWRIPKSNEKKNLFASLMLFSPAVLVYTLEGRSDIFMYTFALLSFYLLEKKKYTHSSVFLAMAFAIKQSIWPIFPFYFLYVYLKENGSKLFYKSLLFFACIFLILTLPFYFWNGRAFIDSTIGYLSGKIEHSYPISGYGFSMVLVQAGFVKDVHKYFPFELFQLVFGLPVLLVSLRILVKNKTIKTMLFAYGIFLSVYWYFSRYFNNSHMAYLSLVFVTSYFWPDKSEVD